MHRSDYPVARSDYESEWAQTDVGAAHGWVAHAEEGGASQAASSRSIALQHVCSEALNKSHERNVHLCVHTFAAH